MSVFAFRSTAESERALLDLLESKFGKGITNWGLNGFRSVWLVGYEGIQLQAVEEPRMRALFLDFEEPEPWRKLLSQTVDELSLSEVLELARSGTDRTAYVRIAAYHSPDDPDVESLIIDELNRSETWRVVSALQAAEYVASERLDKAIFEREDDPRIAVSSTAQRIRHNRADEVEFVADRVLADIERAPGDVLNKLQDEMTAAAFALGVTFELVSRSETKDKAILGWETFDEEMIRMEYRLQRTPPSNWIRVVSTSPLQNRLMIEKLHSNEAFLNMEEGFERCTESDRWSDWLPSLASVTDDEFRPNVRQLVKRGLEDESWKIRVDSAWAAAALNDDESFAVLRSAARAETHQAVKESMLRLLADR